MPGKKKSPVRTANTAALRDRIDGLTCYDTTRETAKKVERWRQEKLAQLKETGRSPKQQGRSKSAGKSKDEVDECMRSESFCHKHENVRKGLPAGFEELLDRMIREVLLTKPMRIYEFFADLLEAEMLRETLKKLQAEKKPRRKRGPELVDLPADYPAEDYPDDLNADYWDDYAVDNEPDTLDYANVPVPWDFNYKSPVESESDVVSIMPTPDPSGLSGLSVKSLKEEVIGQTIGQSIFHRENIPSSLFESVEGDQPDKPDEPPIVGRTLAQSIFHRENIPSSLFLGSEDDQDDPAA